MREGKGKQFYVHYLPVYGCISTGMVYTAIGVIAILSYLQVKQGGADESSLLVFLNDYLVGSILVWVILLGTMSYILWRIYESITDPYNYGRGWRGVARRTGIGLSSIADMLIAYSAIIVLLGTSKTPEDGQPREQREMVGSMLQESWGDYLIIGIGAVVAITAGVQFFYGITRGYKERLDIGHFSREIKELIHFLAWVGYSARGIILGIIGFFFIKAGLTEDPQQVVNTDKAFDFLGDHVGHLYFIVVAMGTICYGCFMFFLGGTYDADNEGGEEKLMES